VTRAEIERMSAAVKERVLQSPEKAAKILSQWIGGEKKSSKKEQKKDKQAA
jgi:hypothetical protein